MYGLYQRVGVKQWSVALQVLIVGFYVPISLLTPTGIGFLLDRNAGHGFPLYALIGLGIGTVIMVYGVFRIVKPFLDEAKEITKKKKMPSQLVRIMASNQEKQNNDGEGKL
jgi:hypothetical protein